MPLLSPRRTQRATHRLIAAVVAVSLLSMPVTYRGGAEAAHAHTIFQLWADVHSGSFTHHTADGHAHRGHAGESEEHTGMDSASRGDHRHQVTTATSSHVEAAARVDVDASKPATVSPAGLEAGSIQVDEDAPTMGSAFAPSVRGTVLALPTGPDLAVAESFHSAHRRTLAPDGVADSPTAPPPRQAA